MSQTEKYLLWMGGSALAVFAGETMGGGWRLLSALGSVVFFYNALAITDEVEGAGLFAANQPQTTNG